MQDIALRHGTEQHIYLDSLRDTPESFHEGANATIPTAVSYTNLSFNSYPTNQGDNESCNTVSVGSGGTVLTHAFSIEGGERDTDEESASSPLANRGTVRKSHLEPG